jgi:hypothetical protein
MVRIKTIKKGQHRPECPHPGRTKRRVFSHRSGPDLQFRNMRLRLRNIPTCPPTRGQKPAKAGPARAGAPEANALFYRALAHPDTVGNFDLQFDVQGLLLLYSCRKTDGAVQINNTHAQNSFAPCKQRIL